MWMCNNNIQVVAIFGLLRMLILRRATVLFTRKSVNYLELPGTVSLHLYLTFFVFTDDGSVWGWGYNVCILWEIPWVIRLVLFAWTYWLCNCLVHVLLIILFLDYLVDGQLGFDGENSLVPHLLEGFLELGSPNSSASGSERKKLMVRTSWN